jgi:hypothetical protein
MRVIERYPAEFDRMPNYGAEGCTCGSIATPDRRCPLHAANWIIERLEDQLRGADQLQRVLNAFREPVTAENAPAKVHELQSRIARLETQLRGAVEAERTRILAVAHKVLSATDYNALVKTLAGWPAPERGQ